MLVNQVATVFIRDVNHQNLSISFSRNRMLSIRGNLQPTYPRRFVWQQELRDNFFDMKVNLNEISVIANRKQEKS